MKEEGKIKILGLVQKSTGSHFHRIVIPLTYLQGKEVEIEGEKYIIETNIIYREENSFYFTEQDVKENDIIANNFNTLNNPAFLETLCEMHGTKRWLDIDDATHLPDNHINIKAKGKEMMNYSEQSLHRSISCADLVTCTNDYILSSIVNLASFIGTSENYLPDDGEFKVVEKSKRDGKIAIGVICSVSHYNDILSIRNAIQKLSDDSDIQKNCKWVVCGYIENDPLWTQIKNIFSGNSKMEVVTIPAKDPSEYMNLYDEVDILLNPLENTEFNSKKSALKLLECSIKEVVMLSSPVYLNKEFSGFVVCNKTKDWYQSIKKLIKNDEYLKIGKAMSEINLKDNHFDYRMDKLKIGIQHILQNEYKMDENLKVYGIVYKDDQFTPFIKYDNSHIKTVEQKSYLFESNPIIDIIDNQEFDSEDYCGIFSWKFIYKTHISKKLLNKSFMELKKENFDVIGLSPDVLKGMYLKFTEDKHPGFLELFIPLCNDLGLQVTEPKHVIYSNFAIMKADLYKRFISEILKPAINLLETKYKDLAWRDSTYQGLTKEELQKASGLDFYPFHTFILERLMSVWLENHPELTFYQLG